MTSAEDVEHLYSELFEAASVGRQHGEGIAALVGQTQSRWQTLWTIGAAPLTVPQVARRLGVSRQHILRLANDLESEGLVEFHANPDHKTSPLLALTARGRSVLDTINTAGREANEAMLREFSAENVAQLRALLQEFVRIVKATGVQSR